MLNSFIDSKSKRRLLNAFFRFPERSFYQTELRELTRLSPRSLSLILSELVAENVLKMFIKQRRKYFQINRHLDWYDELSELVSGEKIASIAPASKLVRALAGGSKAAILTGIFTARPRTAADLVLVGAGPHAHSLNRLLEGLEKLAGQEINYCVMDANEYEYRQHMHDRFIRDVLDNPHVAVIDKLKNRRTKELKNN